MTRDELARRIADVSLLHGTFTLRSGRTSSFYLDKYLFSTRPEILVELGRMFAGRLPGGTTRLAGAELGGIPLVPAASLASGLPCVFVRNEKKGYGTARQLEGVLEPGDRVVIVEDVATTGGQVLEAAKVIVEAGGEVVRIIATVDRLSGARENIEAAGFAYDTLFTIRDLGIDPTADGG
ncbi:MAG: orotate phosphoribosyltransferase [Planctomycetota bacterium]|jgi:orotate phosphoribosyltransferase